MLAREVLTEVFLSTSGVGAEQSALFVAWGQLVAFDLFVNADNSSEPLDVDCDSGGGFVDVWCPFGEDSDPIPFDRSEATLASSAADGGEAVRSPVNYATAYLDLDFVYGRTEVEARALRTQEGGFMNVSESGIPHPDGEGGWKVSVPVA